MRITMNKKSYHRPQLYEYNAGPEQPLLALSIGENTEIGVIPDESQDAENALVKETPFDFEWD